MATQVQWRGGSTAEHSTFTGAAREVTVDTQKKTLVVHDGSTPGGEPLLREDQANLPTSVTNGISVPSANNVAISTNGTGRLLIDASGRLQVGEAGNTGANVKAVFGNGLNTTNGTVVVNTEDADVNGLTISNWTGFATSYGPRIGFSNSTFGDFSIGCPNGSDGFVIRDVTSASDRLTIDSSGRVGLGTSSPGEILSIVTSSSDGSALFVASTKNSGLVRATTGANAWDLNGGIVTFGSNAKTVTDYSANITRFNTDKSAWALQFKNATSSEESNDFASIVRMTAGGTQTTPLYINASGHVGIGTTSPGARCQISTTNVGDVNLALSGPTSDNNWGGYLTLNSNNGTTVTAGIRTSTGGMFFYYGGSERARIDSSGRLLVGTSSTSSTGSLVQVNGRVEQVDGVFTKRALSTYTTGQTVSVTVANAPAAIGNSESSIYKVFATRAQNASTVTFEHGFVYYSSNGTGTYVSVVDDANTTVSVSGTTISAQNTGGSATLRLVVTCETTAFNTGS